MLSEGTVIEGRYVIEAPIGEGGMGIVYRARHLGLGIDVALKVLHTRFGAGPGAIRFEREARAARCLDHPGCVRVLDQGKTADGQLYLAMELLEGPSLADRLATSGRASRPDAIRIAVELCEALAHAHSRGVLHRDVKPANLVLGRRDGHPRFVLVDFGFAKLVDDAPLTALGECAGSPSYLAPERLLGRPYDGRADLYGAGIVLYEMLTGTRPFHGATAVETARQQIGCPPPPIRASRPDVSPALEAVIVRALQKDPKNRFADAEQMRRALVDASELDTTMPLQAI